MKEQKPQPQAQTTQQPMVCVTPQQWDDLIGYVTAIQPPYPLIEAAYRAKQAILNAKAATLNIPKPTEGTENKEGV